MAEQEQEEVWVTGIGLVSSLGDGCEEHWQRIGSGAGPEPVIDAEAFAPYPVHPLVEVDFSAQVPKRGDLRQMGRWQSIGVYAAGLALSDAGMAGDQDQLDAMDMIVAANGGERDLEADDAILKETSVRNDPDGYLNEALTSELRPTLFLAQLPNLMAGNISIVHKVSGSSRTFMGEEMAGVSAAQVAVQKIRAGQSGCCLVGGAYNAEREDMQFLYELGAYLWPRGYRPVWERNGHGGGIITGSVGAFLVLESKTHAEARGAKPYARIHDVLSDRCSRKPGAAAGNAWKQFETVRNRLTPGPLPLLSGACGAEPVTSEEVWFMDQLREKGFDLAIRSVGSLLGHSAEASFPAGLALAAMAASKGRLFGPVASSEVEKPYNDSMDAMLVTSWGHWRGEALALVEAVH